MKQTTTHLKPWDYIWIVWKYRQNFDRDILFFKISFADDYQALSRQNYLMQLGLRSNIRFKKVETSQIINSIAI